jgi:hypothetical protein
MRTTFRSIGKNNGVIERSSHLKSELSAYNGSCVEVSVDNKQGFVSVGDTKHPQRKNQIFRTLTWALLIGDMKRGNGSAVVLAALDGVPILYSTRPDRAMGLMVRSRTALDEGGTETIIQLGSYLKFSKDQEPYCPEGLLEFTFDEWNAFHDGVINGEFDETVDTAISLAEKVQKGAFDLGHAAVGNGYILAA